MPSLLLGTCLGNFGMLIAHTPSGNSGDTMTTSCETPGRNIIKSRLAQLLFGFLNAYERKLEAMVK